MKIKYSFLNFFKAIAFIFLFSFSLTVFAKEINLYDQPKADAKIVSKVDLSVGIVPIFTPKEGGWIKVGDPRNGNVGWVKTSDLSGTGGTQSTFSFTQSTLNDNQSPVTYRIIQFGEPKKLTPEQQQSIEKQIKLQQQAIQNAVQNMLHNMNRISYDAWPFSDNSHFPLLMPVVVLPAQTTAPAGANQKTPEKTTTNTKK